MSETKFTKGEWAIQPPEDDKEYIRIRGSVLGGRFKIANVVNLKKHHDGLLWRQREVEETIANANLIAAAPEMYAMLETALSEMHVLIDEVNDQRMSHVNSMTETPPDLHDGQTLHEIQTILAKARGES